MRSRRRVTGNNDPLVTGWAQARKIAVMPRLNCQNPSDEKQILNEPAVRAGDDRTARLAVRDIRLQGIQIDFEGAPPTERNPFTAFITALAARLHAQGDKLSTVVTAKYYNVPTGRAAMYDDAALSVPPTTCSCSTGVCTGPPPVRAAIDEFPWFKQVAEYTATMPNRASSCSACRCTGSTGPNGGGPSNPGTPLEYNNITALASEFGVTPRMGTR